MAMWAVFAKSFRTQLTAVLGYDAATAKQITKTAKPKYKEIIAKLPEFEKRDRFQLNIIGCAMLGAFVLCIPKRPDAEALTVYYENAQMTPLMKWFCRQSGKSKFTPKDIAGMKATAALKAADRNPYSWNMDFYEYPDGSGYEGRFTRCGICVLMKELGLYDLTPRPVPTGLHHERSRRRDELCAAVYPCLRRTLLRLRVQKERVTDDEEEGNLSFP